MPRRRPAVVRRRPTRPAHREQIDGLSRGANHVIDDLDRRRRHPGATADALRFYDAAVDDPAHRLWDPSGGCGRPECCPDPFELRGWLEVVLHHLPPRDHRRLGRRIATIDDRW